MFETILQEQIYDYRKDSCFCWLFASFSVAVAAKSPPPLPSHAPPARTTAPQGSPAANNGTGVDPAPRRPNVRINPPPPPGVMVDARVDVPTFFFEVWVAEGCRHSKPLSRHGHMLRERPSKQHCYGFLTKCPNPTLFQLTP